MHANNAVAMRSNVARGGDRLLALIALAALLLGVLDYVLGRPAGSAYLLPRVPSFHGTLPYWFVALGNCLPDFVHVYAFILLTVAVSPWPKRILPICVGWWVVDSLFEVGQHPLIAPYVAASLPGWFQRLPIFDHASAYFLHGTFDLWDLASIALGTGAAYMTVTRVRQAKERGATAGARPRAWPRALAVAWLAVLSMVSTVGSGGGGGGGGGPTTYTISGSVIGYGNGLTVSLTGSASAGTAADPSGSYTFGGLSNGSYTVTPSVPQVVPPLPPLPVYGFNPPYQNVSVNGSSVGNVNFNAVPGSQIYGTITLSGGGALPGVSVSLSGVASGTATTDANGIFSFVPVPDGSITVTPSLAGYTFSPSSRKVTVSGASVPNVDFTATPAIYKISGTVTVSGGGALSGATVYLTGASVQTATTDAAGNYTLAGLSNGSYEVTPSVSGYTFAPTMRPATIAGANSAGNNFTASAMNWTIRSFGNSLRSVAWSGMKFAAVGDSMIATSPDGVTWTPQPQSPNISTISRVIWTGSQFAAVAGGSFLTSPDGSTWTATSTGTTAVAYGLAWSGSRYVAVGISAVVAGVGMIISSADGVTWSSQSAANMLSGVTWSGTQFVAVGNSGTILTSPDGTTWTARTSGTANGLQAITWSGTTFVAGGGSGTILTSPDGVTWSTQTSGTSAAINQIVWSGTQFAAVADGSGGAVSLTSPDGVTWTSHASGASDLSAIAWSGSKFVAVGAGGTILTSADGAGWTTQKTGLNVPLFGATWSGTEFVVVGDKFCNGTCSNSAILTSPDGVAWTAQNSGTTDTLYDVAWSGTKFVAVGGSSGVSGTILTSPDGVSWTGQISGTTNLLHRVTWSGTQFVAVGGFSGVGGTILTSPDGVIWTPRSSGTTGFLYDVAWSGSQFVAVGGDFGTGTFGNGTILTSPDGATWTPQTPATTDTLSSVVWSGTQFVAAAATGVQTSPDGVHWTAQASGTGLGEIVWSGSYFVLADGELSMSADGILWTNQAVGANEAVTGLVWSGTKFVALGAAGGEFGVILTSP